MALSSSEQLDQDRSKLPSQTTTNTGIGNLIAKTMQTNRSLVIPKWSTLNEKYGILASQSIGTKRARDFELKYFGVGGRGSNCDGTNPNGMSRMKVNQHQPIDADLYAPLPLIARPLDNPLDNETRKQYRVRVVANRNGVDHEFFFWKLVKWDRYDPKQVIVNRDPSTGNEPPRDFIPAKEDLTAPEPLGFTSDGTVPVSNDFLNGTAIINCSMDETDLQEFRNACRLYFGDASYATISEVGLGYGIDVPNTEGAIATGKILYTEVMSAIYAHYITEQDGRNANTNRVINLAFDHGVSEPMLLHTGSTQAIQPGVGG